MSYCYDMLHEIKRSLGESANQEYINHINLLKIIKQDIEQEKSKFKERTQGAEMSLFIENIFEVASHEVKAPSDASNPKALVANVLEKKALIEKLQEKMSQRLDIINNLLASHTMIQSTQNTSTAPNIMKSNVKMVNLNFENLKYNLNFYNSKPNESQLDWSNVISKSKAIKPKKNFSKAKESFKSKQHFSNHDAIPKKKRSTSNTRTIFNEIMTKSPFLDKVGRGSIQASPFVKSTKAAAEWKRNKARRKSIDGIKQLANHFLVQDSENDDETPHNVRLYLDPNHLIGSTIVANKESTDLSPINLEEEALFPNDLGRIKRPLISSSHFKSSKKKANSNRVSLISSREEYSKAGRLFQS